MNNYPNGPYPPQQPGQGPYTQYPQHQGYPPSQQPQYPPQGYPQLPVQPQKPPKPPLFDINARREYYKQYPPSKKQQIIIGISALVGILLLCSICSAISNASNTTESTKSPTLSPTSQSGSTEGSGPANLGAPISNFTRIYGQPNSGTSSPGVYEFDSLQVLTATDEGNRVNSITATNGDTDWGSLQSAMPNCEKFMPSDATYQRVVELYNPANSKHTDTERVYFSSQLAPLFKASDYTDEHGALATPGTFAIVYEYDLTAQDPSTIDGCSIQVGLQQIQKS